MQTHCWMTEHRVAAECKLLLFAGWPCALLLEPSTSYHPQLSLRTKPFVTKQTSTGDPLVSLHVRNPISESVVAHQTASASQVSSDGAVGM